MRRQTEEQMKLERAHAKAVIYIANAYFSEDYDNQIIQESLEQIEPRIRMILFEDVAKRIGYFNSEAVGYMCKRTYYRRRVLFIRNVNERIKGHSS